MAKSNYHIKETKNSYKLSYSGDLAEALEKAKEDLKKTLNDQELQYWIWIKDKAEKAINANSRKIERLQAFIKVAERQLKESEEKE